MLFMAVSCHNKYIMVWFLLRLPNSSIVLKFCKQITPSGVHVKNNDNNGHLVHLTLEGPNCLKICTCT